MLEHHWITTASCILVQSISCCIEITAALNPGVDGGPLVDEDGRLIGLLCLNYSTNRWLGTAIPVDLLKNDLSRLGSIEGGNAGSNSPLPTRDRFHRRSLEGALERIVALEVDRIEDVGVAGPHRLLEQRDRLGSADAIVVVAGMEGALPSVVGGWVSCPVVAVPTSVGYGAALGGLAALLGMLNSCAANVAVVNIDAGFKAGFVAGLIARGSAGGDGQ